MKLLVSILSCTLLLVGCSDSELDGEGSVNTNSLIPSINSGVFEASSTNTSGDTNTDLNARLVNGEDADSFENMWLCLDSGNTELVDAYAFLLLPNATGAILFFDDGVYGSDLSWSTSGNDFNFTIEGVANQFTLNNLQFTDINVFTVARTVDGVFGANTTCRLSNIDDGTPVTDTTSTVAVTGNISSTGSLNGQLLNVDSSDNVTSVWFCQSTGESLGMVLGAEQRAVIGFESEEFSYYTASWSLAGNTAVIALDNNSRVTLSNISMNDVNTMVMDSFTHDNASYGAAACVRVDNEGNLL